LLIKYKNNILHRSFIKTQLMEYRINLTLEVKHHEKKKKKKKKKKSVVPKNEITA